MKDAEAAAITEEQIQKQRERLMQQEAAAPRESPPGDGAGEGALLDDPNVAQAMSMVESLINASAGGAATYPVAKQAIDTVKSALSAAPERGSPRGSNSEASSPRSAPMTAPAAPTPALPTEAEWQQVAAQAMSTMTPDQFILAYCRARKGCSEAETDADEDFITKISNELEQSAAKRARKS